MLSRINICEKMKSAKWFRIARGIGISFLLIFAVVSMVQGFLNGLEHSQDFQWSPSRILLFRDNPYMVHLEGDPDKRILLSQAPNYTQLLYILLAPYAALPFFTAKALWAITNILFAIFSVGACARVYSLNRIQLLTIGCLFLMSTPTRNTIGNGQHSLMILAALIASIALAGFIKRGDFLKTSAGNKWRYLSSAFFAGLTYVKYSFAPTLGIAFYRRHGLNFFLLSLFPVLFGAIIFGAWTGQNPLSIEFLTQPYRVASSAVSSGAGDLLTILKTATPDNADLIKISTLSCLILAGAAPYTIRHSNRNSLEWWSFCSVASLTFVTHLGYDYVFYLFPALFAAKNLRNPSGKALALLIAYPWFISKVLNTVGIDKTFMLIAAFAVNLLILCILYREMRRKPEMVAAQ